MTPTPSSSPASRRRQAAAAATARRKLLAKRALHVGNVLLLLVAADWVLQQPGVEAHRVAAVSAYMLQQGAAALLLAAEWLPGAVAVFTPADRSALQTALFGCVGACNDYLQRSGNDTYCQVPWGKNPPWKSGTGAGCNASSTHGAINAWDVSRVTSMYRMF